MSQPYKILTVDDSMLTRVRFVATPLRAAGYEVIEAVNGKDGLEKFNQHTPDCVITDLLMPEMDGFQFTQALRDAGQDAPVIVVSADIQNATRERVGQLGVFRFLNKPFDKADLLSAVAEALGSERTAEEAAGCC